MASVRIMVTYDGEWVKSPETGLLRFNGSKAKGMSVPKNITHRELSNRVYTLLGIDRDEHTISMKFLYASGVPASAPAEIAADDDANFFLCENSGDVSLRTPLCVTLTPIDRNQRQQQQQQEQDASSGQREALTKSEEEEEEEKEKEEEEEDDDFFEFRVRRLFSSKKELRARLSLLAIRKDFEFRVKRSSPDMLVVGCVDDACRWRLRACRVHADGESFQIRRFDSEHSCPAGGSRRGEHRQASSWVVSQLIKSKCRGTPSRDYRPKDVIEDVRRELGVGLSYEKAWRAREIALGSPEEGPPRQRRLSGKRERSSGGKEEEERRIRSCKRCGEVGHYSKTCSIPVTTLALQEEEEERVVEENIVILKEERVVEEDKSIQDEVMGEDKVGES